jgi:DivIVA domain-containing protein
MFTALQEFFKSNKSESNGVREEQNDLTKRSSIRRSEGLTPEDVVNQRFGATKFRGGYDQDEVDDFLDEIVVELRRLQQEENDLRVARSQGSLPPVSTSNVTPEYVVNKRFGPTKFREGYDQNEVDDFLDEIVIELQRRGRANDETRSAVARLIEENGKTV